MKEKKWLTKAAFGIPSVSLGHGFECMHVCVCVEFVAVSY